MSFGQILRLLAVVVLCLVPGHETGILNRMLAHWQPNDVYVIWNSTIHEEDAIGRLGFPCLVSTHGDFSSFLKPTPIRSVFPDNFVLVLFTDDSLRSVIPILRDQLSQEIIVKRSKVVIVAKDVQEADVEKMFHDSWTLGLLNVFLLDDSSIFGFNPFVSNFLIHHPNTDYHRLISIDRAANFHGALLTIPLIEIYPGAQHLIRKNHSMWVGENIYVQRPLAQYFNATLHIYPPKVIDFGFEFFTNATASIVHPGMGAELAAGRANLTLIHRVYSASNYFDFLSPLNLRECTLLIPKAGRIPQYTIVASVAFSWVGLSSILTLISIVAFVAILKRVLRVRVNIASFFLQLACVFIGQPFRFIIRTVSMRLTVFCWLVTCIWLGTLFNAEIVMSFLTPLFIADVDSPIEAIRGDGFDIYTFEDFVYYLRGNAKALFPSEEVFQLLLKKLKGVPREEFFYRVMHPNKRDMFLVIFMGDILQEKTKYLTEQTYTYHNTKPFFISLIANIVPRGSIIYNHYNDFNYRIFEAGLVQHWKRLEMFYEIKFGSGNEAQERSLTIEDLYSAFLVLGLGYALAGTAFVVEAFVEYFGRKFTRWLSR